MTREELENKRLVDLKKIAKDENIKKVSALKKADLINLLVDHFNQKQQEPVKQNVQKKEEKYQASPRNHKEYTRDNNHYQRNNTSNHERPKQNSKYSKLRESTSNTIEATGVLEIKPEGFGIVKIPENEPPFDQIYVSSSQIQKFKLNTNDRIGGKIRAPKQGEKYAAMLFLEEVNDKATSKIIQEMDELMKSEAHDSESRFQDSHTGILDVNPDGYGFLRVKNYMPGEGDIYVAANQIRRYGLRTGDKVTGKIRKSGENDKNDALLYIEEVNGEIPEMVAHRPHFDKLVPIFPREKLTLETDSDTMSTRLIDLFVPLGKGQRGMIVAPPKAGKTTLLKEIAHGIRTNYPDVELIILLVDERPEEVTDMQRCIDADIVYSTFDQPPQNHLAVAEMVLERSKRLVEQGKDVVVLVDSLTRLTRANNLCVEPSGRTLSGGMDPESLYFPKKLFGSARNIENGASLTIIATALIETGSRMDDIVFEEFKGTGNMEINLERELAQRRIFPAINLQKSGTRREDLLLNPTEQKGAFAIRKMYDQSPVQMTDKVINAFSKTTGNQDFLKQINKER